jgi:hypothetical protein
MIVWKMERREAYVLPFKTPPGGGEGVQVTSNEGFARETLSRLAVSLNRVLAWGRGQARFILE